MKRIETYITERGAVPAHLQDNMNPKIAMIGTIIRELSKCKNFEYDEEKNTFSGKDAEILNSASKFLYDYLSELSQDDFKDIVEYFDWKKWITDINDISLDEISMCVALCSKTFNSKGIK